MDSEDENVDVTEPGEMGQKSTMGAMVGGGIGGIAGPIGGAIGAGIGSSLSGNSKAMSCYKSLMDASGFLGSLSKEKTFGDPHREAAMMHHKALDPMHHEFDEDFEGGERTEPDDEVMDKALDDEDLGIEGSHEPGEEAPDEERAEGREVGKKAFDEMKDKDDDVDVTEPKGPTKYKPNTEPAQMFGKKDLEDIAKENKETRRRIKELTKRAMALASSL